MKITILGCGGAAGVPMISRGWGACNPDNPKNKRLRTSLLLQDKDVNVLFDTGPDLRQQLLNANISCLDAVLYTHEHADHTHGIDDLREINRVIKKQLPIYANDVTLNHLQERFSYVFKSIDSEKETFFHPWLEANLIVSGEPFHVKHLKFMPFSQDHEWTTTLGFRVRDFAYSTDVVHLYDSSLSILKGVKTWVVGCLSDKTHPSHACIQQVLDWVEIIKPERTILTHMAAGLDYDKVSESLPKGIEVGYDGLCFEIN